MKAMSRIALVAVLTIGISLFMAPTAHAATKTDQLQTRFTNFSAVATAKIAALQSADAALANQIAALAARFTNFSAVTTAKIAAQNVSALTARFTNFSTAYSNSNVYALNPYVSVNTNAINGLNGPHVIFTGANVHIRSGAGSTDEGKLYDQNTVLTGLGNLVLGYNEPHIAIDTYGNPYTDLTGRGGSHNLIGGTGHKYESFGGFVAGAFNNISGFYSSVSGGNENKASGPYSSVSGGEYNTASNNFSSGITTPPAPSTPA